MPQNRTSSKTSSIIGITLLLLVIGFTVFINFFTEAPIETEVVKEEAEEIYFKPFDENDLANFWKLNNVYTDSITIDEEKNLTYMKIYKQNTTASNLTSYYGTVSMNTTDYTIIDDDIPYDENASFTDSVVDSISNANQ